MDIEGALFKLGIPTWVIDMETPFVLNGSSGQNNVPIGKNLPTNVGYIYGLLTYADSTDPTGQTPLPTTTQCQNIYVNFQNGSTLFMESIRLDDLLNVYAGTPIVRPEGYYKVSIPAFDLSKSFFLNPNLYTGFTVRLKLRYIEMQDWKKIAPHLGTHNAKPKK